MAFTSSSSSSSDNKVAPCSEGCSKAYATLQSHYDKLTVDFRKSQFDVLSYKSELRKKFEKAKKERVEFKQTLEKIQTLSKNLSKLLENQITDKTGLGYDIQVFNSQVINYDDLTSSESDDSVPTSPVHHRYKSGEGYHVVLPPYTGTFMPPKPDLVFHDAPTASETDPNVFHVKPSTTKPNKDKSQSNRPSAPIIADWVSDSEDEFEDCDFYEKQMVHKPVRNHAIRVSHQNSSRMTHPHSNKHVVSTLVLTRSRLVPLNAARRVTTAVSQTTMKNQRPAKHVVNKPHSPLIRPINHRPAPKNSNFHQKVTTVKTKKINVIQGTKGNWYGNLNIQVSNGLGPQKTLSLLFDVQGNPQQALKDRGVIDNGCSRHMTENISYLFDFEEINKGYAAIGRNPKGDKITGK
nr:hypothetical protein [Tanacetum cinerariifolium]